MNNVYSTNKKYPKQPYTVYFLATLQLSTCVKNMISDFFHTTLKNALAHNINQD